MKINDEINAFRGLFHGVCISVVLWYVMIYLFMKLADIFLKIYS
jgi:hypothetical protein